MASWPRNLYENPYLIYFFKISLREPYLPLCYTFKYLRLHKVNKKLESKFIEHKSFCNHISIISLHLLRKAQPQWKKQILDLYIALWLVFLTHRYSSSNAILDLYNNVLLFKYSIEELILNKYLRVSWHFTSVR